MDYFTRKGGEGRGLLLNINMVNRKGKIKLI